MAIPYDLDLPASSDNQLEPAVTLADIGRIASSPPTAPEPSLADIGQIARGNVAVDVTAPAPTTREGQIAERNAMAYEGTYNPAGPTGNVTNPLNLYQSIQRFAPEGTNPRIKYPEAAPDDGTLSSLIAKYGTHLATGGLDQVPLGVLQGGAALKKQYFGIVALAGQDHQWAKEGAGFDQFSKQVGDLGESMAATPADNLVRNVSANVTEMAPILATDGLSTGALAAEGIEAGAASKFSLGALSAAFGLTAAGSGYNDAVEANYPHPDLYALGSGIIAAGTALIPGYQGQNSVAKAANMIEAKPWEDYIHETINKYANRQFLETHGGAMALQGAVQSALQGSLNKATIDPDASWTSIVTDAFKAAGFGAIMGEGFGALHQHDNNELAGRFQKFAQDAQAADQQAQAADRAANSAQSFQLPSDTGSALPQGSFRMVPPVSVEAAPPENLDDESSFADARARNQGSLRATQDALPPNAIAEPSLPGEIPGVPRPSLPAPSIPGEVPSIPVATPQNPGGSLRSLAPELQTKSNAVREQMRAEYEALKAKATPAPVPATLEAATIAPEKPATKASLPEGTIPGRGQNIDLGNKMYVTRNHAGKVVVRQEGNARSLATLKNNDAASVSKTGLLADLQRYNAGHKTVAWDFNDTGASANPLLTVGRKQVAEEATHAALEHFQKDVVAALDKDTPEDKSIARAIASGTVSPTSLSGLVGKATVEKGAAEVAKILRAKVAAATKQYLNGKLLERAGEGVAAEVPAELKDEEGKLLPLAKRKALQDKEGRAARVLDLLVKQQLVKEDVDEGFKSQAAGLDRGDVERPQNHEQDPNAIAPVNKSGFADEDVLTQFTDEQVKKWPKETALANEVKEEVLQGDVSRYDEGVAALVKMGYKQPTAERWMESEGLFMAPRHLQPSNRVFSTQLEKELATYKPYGIAPTKTGGIPVGALKSRMQKVSEGEYRMLQTMGLDNFLAGKTTITAKLLNDWVAEHGPKVVVKKFGVQDYTPEEKQLYEDKNKIQHELDTKFPGWSDTNNKYNTEQFFALREKLNEAERAVDKMEDESSYPAAHWAFVAPKAEKDMDGYAEIAIVKPQKQRVYADKSVSPGQDLEDPRFPSSHNFPPNTLAFARGYMETDAKTGEKTWHIIEVQSDWAQRVRDYKEKLKNPAGDWDAERGLKHADDPLLAHYETLALKASIQHALEQGATRIAISDGETAMMSEGHDRAATQHPDGWNYQEPEQAAGMRLHYDKTLPSALEKLTGEKGQHVELGEHKNVYDEPPRVYNRPLDSAERALEENAGKPRKDLIFKNPDGTPKTSVTARSYSLDKVDARRETGEPFTYSGKSYAPSLGGAKPATSFPDELLRRTYESRGLTAPTMDVPIKVLAQQTARPDVAALAQQLLKYAPELAAVKLGNEGGALQGSHYDADNNVVKIAIGGFPTPDDLTDATFHEAVHALLVRRMHTMGPDSPEMAELGRLYNQAQALYGTAGDALTAAERRAVTYGLKDPDEFMAMGMTDGHFRNFLGTINAEGGTLWQKFKAWVYNVATGRSLYTGNDVVRRLFERVMDQAPVSNADWKASRADNIGDRTVLPGAFPAIRTVPEYNEIKNYRSGDLTPEEQEIVTRKALVNNNWIQDPAIREILAKSAPESKSMLKAIFGPRENVITQAEKDPGGTKPSTYAHIMADGSLTADDKSGMSMSTMHNLVQFDDQALTVDRRFANATKKMVDRLKKIEPAMDDLQTKRIVMESVIKSLSSDMKNRILREKEVSASEDRLETLNRMAKMLDQVRGSHTALSKYMDAVAAAVPLDDLLAITNRAELYKRIQEALPINEETARRIGASTETMRLASVIMANSNVLREELLNLHLVHDPDTLAAANQLGDDLKAQAKAGNINNALSHFTGQVSSYATQKERAVSLWKSLNSERTKLMNSVARLAGTKNALDAVKQAPSYRSLSDRVYGDNKLVKVQRQFGPTGELIYTHPMTREPVSISATFAQEGREENMRKMLDLNVAAKNYLALAGSKNYDPAEAPFWRNFIANSDFELDPTVNLSASKLVRAAYDPYKLVLLGGGLVSIPDHTLQLVGGDLAVKAQAALQAYSAVVTQISHPIIVRSAGIEDAAKSAAAAHNLSIPDWDREVLAPLIHSRQQVGYQTLHAGAPTKTIYGHAILPEDEVAFQRQRALDRDLVAIGLGAHDNPAVAANPARVAFTSPSGATMTRQIASSGPDTMSRHLGVRASTLAGQWFEARTPEAKVGFMDDNFIPVVMSHIDAVGAPDYSIKSSQNDIYRAAIKQHQTVPFDSTQGLVDFLFDAQNGRRDPEAQHSSQYIKGVLMAELDKAFTKIGDGFKAQSSASPEVKGIANFIGTDNSFTQERGKLIAPPALYDYGLTFQGDRIARGHAAAGYYAMQLAGDSGSALSRLTQGLQKTVDSYQSQIRRLTAAGDTISDAKAKLTASTNDEQLKGKLLLTYSQAESALREVRGLHDELKRLLSRPSVTADPVMMQSVGELQAFTTANLLAGVSSRSKHLFGGISNIMDFNKVVLGRSAFMQALPMAIDLAVHTFKDLGAVAPHLGGFLKQTLLDNVAEHRRMEQIGLAPTANVAEEMKVLLHRPASAGRSERTELSPTRKAMKIGETGMRLVAEPLKAYTTRVVDRLLNSLNVDLAHKLENTLRENSVRAGNTRSDMGMRGVFSVPEIFGDAQATPKQGEMLRNLFHKLNLNLDSLMWNYRDAVADAKQKGEDPNAVQFFTPGQRAAIQYVVAQSNNLPTIANRPTSVRGTKGRNVAGQFFGFHLWNASRNSLMLARVSTDKSTFKYMPQLVSRALTLAAMGAAGLVVNNQLKKHVYGETASIPDITEAKNYGEAAGALLNGYAAYTPIFGAAINGIILNKAYGTGFDPTSQFVMLSLANDVFNTTRKIDQTGSAWNPTMQFLRRWAPLSRIVINQLPSQEGLTTYYNTARDLKNLAPADLASAKRGGGQFDATPATPIMQDMLNAAYRGDTQGFRDASDRYLVYEQTTGKTPQQAEQSLQASFRSHNPYVMAFGRLPTAFEQQQIYSNASDDQRAELQRTSQVFQTFGGLLGIHDSETKEASQPTQGGLGGGSTGAGVDYNGSILGDSSLRDSSGYLSGSPRRAPDDNILSAGSTPAAGGPPVTSQRGLLGSPTGTIPGVSRSGIAGGVGLGGGGGSLRIGGGGHFPTGSGGGSGAKGPRVKQIRAGRPHIGLASNHITGGSLRPRKNPGLRRH